MAEWNGQKVYGQLMVDLQYLCIHKDTLTTITQKIHLNEENE